MKSATTSETNSQRSALFDEERLARLERAGIIHRGRHSRLEEIVRVLPPAPEQERDIVAVVLDERRSGR